MASGTIYRYDPDSDLIKEFVYLEEEARCESSGHGIAGRGARATVGGIAGNRCLTNMATRKHLASPLLASVFLASRFRTGTFIPMAICVLLLAAPAFAYFRTASRATARVVSTTSANATSAQTVTPGVDGARLLAAHVPEGGSLGGVLGWRERGAPAR